MANTGRPRTPAIPVELQLDEAVALYVEHTLAERAAMRAARTLTRPPKKGDGRMAPKARDAAVVAHNRWARLHKDLADGYRRYALSVFPSYAMWEEQVAAYHERTRVTAAAPETGQPPRTREGCPEPL